MVSASSVGSGYQLTITDATYSSLRDGSKMRSPRKPGRAKIAGNESTIAQVSHIKYVPEPTRMDDNGWQMRCEDVKTRIASLFNCYTMSDVTFQVDVYHIPAHRFILAAASPVFFKQLYEEDSRMELQMHSPLVSDSGAESFQAGGGHRHITLPVQDVPHLAFFEFLQYIYTDNVHITLENVMPLIFLAESYKVAGLCDRCLAFVRSEVAPSSVLRVIHILRTLMLKACTSLWRELVEQSKAVRKFRQLSLVERRAKLEEMDGSSLSSRAPSRRGSIAASLRLGRRPRSRGSVRSSRSSVMSTGTYGMYRDSDVESLAGDGDFGDAAGALDLAQGYTRKVFRAETWRGQLLDSKISVFVEEMTRRCWQCVQEETGAVITSADMWNQDVGMVRQILRLESCSVPEISLFRAICVWSERRCRVQGMQPSAENRREVLGEETLLLIRFPAMTPEQLHWEVVPTGLLHYEDVQQLLYAMSQRGVPLGRYLAKPRHNLKLQKETLLAIRSGSPSPVVAAMAALAAQGPCRSGPEEPAFLYSAAPDDPLDSILAAELLRIYLKKSTEGHRSNAAIAAAENDSPSPSPGRLPPIASSPPGTARGRGVASPARALSRQTSQMVMGQRLDEEVVRGVLLRGGGRASQPEDWSRVCQSLYRFRESQLVELWLEEGEVMARDHGPCQRLGDAELGCADPSRAREILGLPGLPPTGRGVPLASFLCRQ